jgi:uncharacterized membrane protein YhaH (DUF805 family)
MRTWILCGCMGIAIGFSLVVFMTDFERARWFPAAWWNGVLLIFIPCVLNSLLAVCVYRNQIRREWLLLIMLVPLFPIIQDGAFFPKSIVLFIPALVAWLSGVAGTFVAALCEPRTAQSDNDHFRND